MRIGIVKIGEPVPGEGFRLRRVSRFAHALAERGHQVTWWSSDWCHQSKTQRSMDLLASCREMGFSLRLLPAMRYYGNASPRRLVHHVQFAHRLSRALDDESDTIDLLWICFPTIPGALAAARWARAHCKAHVFDVRDLSPDVFVERAPRAFRGALRAGLYPVRAWIGRSFAKASGLVAVSEGYLRWAVELADLGKGPPADLAVLPLGYAKDAMKESESGRLLKELESAGLRPPPTLRVVYAGTLGSSYDLETVIEASRLADVAGLDLQVLIAGGGDQAGKIKAQAQRNPRVIYLGWLEPKTLQVLLENCDVGLLAYADGATQGLPNKIFEYLGHGLLLANALRGEAADLVERESLGWNYAPGDSDALVKIFEDVCSMADLSQRREANLRFYASKFGQDDLVADMVAFAERIAGGRR